MNLRARPADPADAAAIAAIYNDGIADRIATFETEPRSAAQIVGWFDGRHPIVVVEDDRAAVVAFAATSAYRSRPCYDGIAEFSVYVARGHRGTGAGRVAMTALIPAATAAGYWKLLSRIFPENTASRALMARMGFREVGVYRRHGRLDGAWRDCVIVERLLGAAEESGQP
jgi:L-amino acid N-acyltransferase YncA